MQFQKQPHRFTRHVHIQVVSGVLLMLFGVLYVALPFSARSQEPIGTPTIEPATAEATLAPTDAPTSTPTAAAAPEPPAPTAEEVTPAATEPPAAPPEEPTVAPPETTAAPPIPTFAPVVPAAAPPLLLGMDASAERAGAGQDVRLTATLSSDSDAARAVRVEVELDPQLAAISAEASGGSCAVGVLVVCDVTVQGGTSATINVIGRVRAEAVAGSQLVSQAVARDDANNTAASDPIKIIVSDGLAIVPIPRTAIPVTPTAAESIASAPSPQPTSTPVPATGVVAAPPPQPTSAPQATAAPAAPQPPPQRVITTPQPTDAPHATDDMAAALTPAPAQQGLLEQIAQTAVPTAPAQTPSQNVATPEPVLPTDAPVQTPQPSVSTPESVLPTDAPVQATPADGIFAAPEGERTQLATPTPAAPMLQTEHLPNTDSNAPMLGWSSMLLGFALTAHGTRRVRREHTLLAARGRETRQLEPLVDAIADLSGTVKDETEQMQRISEECIDMLRDGARMADD